MVWQKFMCKDLDLLESGLFADATVTCGERTWKVQKSIICRCEWFMKAFAGNFEEAQTNKVNISTEDFLPELVDCAILFIYSGVVNIEKLNTNDSVVDACVRLWVIADFLVLKELQNEALAILEKYLDEKLKALCVYRPDDNEMFMSGNAYEVLLAQVFRGIETAYTTYPHSVPCQQLLIGFFHAARVVVMSTKAFSDVLGNAPRQFSHELFIAILDGRESKWIIDHKRWLCSGPMRQGSCTGCKVRIEDHGGLWAMDPCESVNCLNVRNVVFDVDWRCMPCLEKHGFDRIQEIGKKP